MNEELTEDLRAQDAIPEELWRPLVTPVRGEVLAGWEAVCTVGGLGPSSYRDLERVVALVRQQSWRTAKICFLGRPNLQNVACGRRPVQRGICGTSGGAYRHGDLHGILRVP
jgi:hypothetical protein